MNDTQKLVEEFLSAGPYAVAGASNDRAKFGNKVLRAYAASGRTVYPVHPKETTVEGLPTYPDVASLPKGVRVLSIVTPPAVTELIVEAAAKAGIRRLWMQPGAESPAALKRAAELGLSVLSGGPCVLVELGAP
jgi:uncharacterized protein